MSRSALSAVTARKAPSHLERIASRAVALYSRPTVALAVMRLAEEPQVDAGKLRECVSQDPALTFKILRVVNSSLFGLNRPVADLGQAIGLLGIKPLKLLALGFNLPDALFAAAAAKQLQWYWTNTLTRAVMARLLAEQLWNPASGGVAWADEAFTAALLQDIGILVLLRELGEPYAKFLNGVIDERCNLAALERETLGFDHLQLSATILERWQMPTRLVHAIALPKYTARLARLESPECDLPQILHLAELLVQLVGQRRLGVLSQILEAGRVYHGMTRAQLAKLVEGLQPQVVQLAHVLSLELTGERDYVRMLLDAHRQMAVLSEEVARPQIQGRQESAQLVSQSQELTRAIESWDRDRAMPMHILRAESVAVSGLPAEECSDTSLDESALARQLSRTGRRCRARRQELSLLIVEPKFQDMHPESAPRNSRQLVYAALQTACAMFQPHTVLIMCLSDGRIASILSNCERQTAVTVAQNTIAAFERENLITHETATAQGSTVLSVGIATASFVPRNFDAPRMIERALRCLSAARICGVSAVKSIEV